MVKIVEYEIPDDGDCLKCKNWLQDDHYTGYCRTFNDYIEHYPEVIQCDECKEFVKENNNAN